MRILIVEDEFLIAMEIEDVVLSLGHDVVGPVASFQQARDLAAETDIALVDVRLKDGATGPHIAEYLAVEHRVAVVFMTANPEAVRTSKAALGVLQKPFGRDEVAEVLNFAVGKLDGRNPQTPKRLELLVPT